MVFGWRPTSPAEKSIISIARGRTERSRRAELDRLTAALVADGAARGAPPDPRRVLDASPWAVVHTTTRVPPLWRAFDWAGPGGALPSQALDGRAGTAVSTLALPWPPGARVVARGTFEREGPTLTVTVGEAAVEGGPGGRTWRLPIKGTGKTTLLYAGNDVRVLRGDGGAIAVQVRQGAL